jgi:hypothetical protein
MPPAARQTVNVDNVMRRWLALFPYRVPKLSHIAEARWRHVISGLSTINAVINPNPALTSRECFRCCSYVEEESARTMANLQRRAPASSHSAFDSVLISV